MGSVAAVAIDPAAGAVCMPSLTMSEIWKGEPRIATADAAVLRKLGPAPGPPQAAPPPTVTDGATGESGAGGAAGALSGVWVT